MRTHHWLLRAWVVCLCACAVLCKVHEIQQPPRCTSEKSSRHEDSGAVTQLIGLDSACFVEFTISSAGATWLREKPSYSTGDVDGDAVAVLQFHARTPAPAPHHSRSTENSPSLPYPSSGLDVLLLGVDTFCSAGHRSAAAASGGIEAEGGLCNTNATTAPPSPMLVVGGLTVPVSGGDTGSRPEWTRLTVGISSGLQRWLQLHGHGMLTGPMVVVRLGFRQAATECAGVCVVELRLPAPGAGLVWRRSAAVDPTTLRRRALSGLLPLPQFDPSICPPIQQSPDGPVLDQIVMEPDGDGGGGGGDADAAAAAAAAGQERLLCGVYSTAQRHSTNILAIALTWGRQCDGFVVLSTEHDDSVSAVELVHEGAERYSNMWRKVRAAWTLIGRHWARDFDYFYLCGDDTFLLVNNLRALLRSPSIAAVRSSQTGLYLGHTLRVPSDEAAEQQQDQADGVEAELASEEVARSLGMARTIWDRSIRPSMHSYSAGRSSYYSQPIPEALFNSGGSGYVLDRVALRVLVAELAAGRCNADVEAAFEDVYVGHCLSHAAGTAVLPFNSSRDEAGRDRFHPLSPGFHAHYLPTPGGSTFRTDWWSAYHDEHLNPFQLGHACCAPSSVAFHYIKTPAALMSMHHYLHQCPRTAGLAGATE